MKLANKNSRPIASKSEPPLVQWTQFLFAIAAMLTATSQVIIAIHH